MFLEMHPFQEVREALNPEVGLRVQGSEAVRRGFQADSGLGFWCPAQGPRWGWGGAGVGTGCRDFSLAPQRIWVSTLCKFLGLLLRGFSERV